MESRVDKNRQKKKTQQFMIGGAATIVVLLGGFISYGVFDKSESQAPSNEIVLTPKQDPSSIHELEKVEDEKMTDDEFYKDVAEDKSEKTEKTETSESYTEEDMERFEAVEEARETESLPEDETKATDFYKEQEKETSKPVKQDQPRTPSSTYVYRSNADADAVLKTPANVDASTLSTHVRDLVKALQVDGEGGYASVPKGAYVNRFEIKNGELFMNWKGLNLVQGSTGETLFVESVTRTMFENFVRVTKVYFTDASMKPIDAFSHLDSKNGFERGEPVLIEKDEEEKIKKEADESKGELQPTSPSKSSVSSDASKETQPKTNP